MVCHDEACGVAAFQPISGFWWQDVITSDRSIYCLRGASRSRGYWSTGLLSMPRLVLYGLRYTNNIMQPAIVTGYHSEREREITFSP